MILSKKEVVDRFFKPIKWYHKLFNIHRMNILDKIYGDISGFVDKKYISHFNYRLDKYDNLWLGYEYPEIVSWKEFLEYIKNYKKLAVSLSKLKIKDNDFSKLNWKF